EIEATALPSIMWPMPSALSSLSSGATWLRLAWNRSDFGVTLSMDGLRFQCIMNVVALEAGFLVVDLHVERQREFAAGEHGIEMAGQRAEDMFAGPFARGEIASLAEPQQHCQEAVVVAAIGNRIILAGDRAHPNAADGEHAGLHRGPAHNLADLADVHDVVE